MFCPAPVDARMVGMSPAAAHRLHVVVMNLEELAEQLDRDREAISFAVDRDSDSPGLGRVAVVVTDGVTGEPVISHLGRVRTGGTRTNLDAIWVLSAIRELRTAIPLAEVTADLGRFADAVRQLATRRRGGVRATRGLRGAPSSHRVADRGR